MTLYQQAYHCPSKAGRQAKEGRRQKAEGRRVWSMCKKRKGRSQHPGEPKGGGQSPGGTPKHAPEWRSSFLQCQLAHHAGPSPPCRRKERKMLFSDHNGSLLRQKPRANNAWFLPGGVLSCHRNCCCPRVSSTLAENKVCKLCCLQCCCLLSGTMTDSMWTTAENKVFTLCCSQRSCLLSGAMTDDTSTTAENKFYTLCCSL